jgi:plasmid stability protein
MRLSIDVPDELHRQIKVKAASEGTSITSIAQKALEAYLGARMTAGFVVTESHVEGGVKVITDAKLLSVSFDPKPLQPGTFVRPISKEDQAKGRTRK